MPYSSKKKDGKITVTKEDTGEVVGHTTPQNYKGYMAALHMHEPKNMADGGLALNEEDDSKIADSNPGHQPEDLESYIADQTAQIDKYGPEQEKAVMDSIIKQRGSLGRGIAHAGATFADALMQGVAGAGNPGFARNLDENQARIDEMRLKEPQTEQAMNAQNMGAKERLAGMSSKSPLGASQTAPLAAFFKRAGVPESEIAKMLANPAAARAVVEPFASVMTAEDKLKMETMLRELELNQRGEQMRGTLANQQEQQDLAEKKAQADAAEKLSKLGMIGRNITNRDEAAKLKELSEGTGPFGKETVRKGKVYIWSPISHKYHPK